MTVRTAHTFREAFSVQRRVIHALIMREMVTRFGTRNLGFLWLFFEPLMLGTMVALVHLGTVSASSHSGVSIFLFYIIGYLPFFAFRSIVNRAPSALHANLTLMFHRMVTLLDIMVARHILEMATVMSVVVMVLVVAALVFDEWTADPLTLLTGFLLMFLLSNGAGLLIGSAGVVSETVDRVLHPITYLMMPFSGCFFAMQDLPPQWREMMLWIPLVHIHEMIRDGQFGEHLISYYSYTYVIGWVIGLNLLGLAALRAVRPRLDVF